jgi:hypothetical protein
MNENKRVLVAAMRLIAEKYVESGLLVNHEKFVEYLREYRNNLTMDLADEFSVDFFAGCGFCVVMIFDGEPNRFARRSEVIYLAF